MKKKIFTALGLMSGTSMDGVDLSIIKSDGYDEFFAVFYDYYEFNEELFTELTLLREKILNLDDLEDFTKNISLLEKKFTLFNIKIINDVLKKRSEKVDLVGFHGQTIFHSPNQKISKQLGDGRLLSQETNCLVVNNFRQNDLKNGGYGAPLTPIFHKLISKKINNKFQTKFPISVINIGGITNVSQIINKNGQLEKSLFAYDIAPGNCLIDEWIRKNCGKKFDYDGKIALSGKVDDLILNQAIENFPINSFERSLDIKDFDTSFVKGLSIEDGCATLTKYTAFLISEGLKKIDNLNKIKTKTYLLCGGGRKNKKLIEDINFFLSDKNIVLKNIDNFNFDGDFIESQAFAYLAIRSFLKLPISFPNTTRCLKAISGGELIQNF